MVRATLRAPMPAMPANGIASPATTTPSTAETATITTRWDSTRYAGSRSWRGMDTLTWYGRTPEPPKLPIVYPRRAKRAAGHFWTWNAHVSASGSGAGRRGPGPKLAGVIEIAGGRLKALREGRQPAASVS